MIRWLVAAYWRRRIRIELTAGVDAAWPSIRRLWAGARRVYKGPVGTGGWMSPEAEVLFDLLKLGDLRTESLLEDGARAADGMVSAYCLAALEIRRSPVLSTLGPPLTESVVPIETAIGSRWCQMTLGEYARGLRETWSKEPGGLAPGARGNDP